MESSVAPLLRYRNRAIGEAELRFIRECLARGPERRTRPQLAREICEAWGWRQANGRLAVYACQDLLLRLEEWGHLRLPAPLRRHRNEGAALPLVPRDHIPLAWCEMGGEEDLNELEVRPIHAEERLGWRLFIDRYHYLGDKPVVGEHLLYAAFLRGEVVALLAWASATLHSPLRERFIGWDEVGKRRGLHLIANNIRFLVPPWVRIKNLASKALGLTLRRLSADWEARWNHPVLLAETFVDHQRFQGTCYRAANWHFLGSTAGRTRRGNAYLHEGSPKGLYVYELHRRARQLLRQESRHARLPPVDPPRAGGAARPTRGQTSGSPAGEDGGRSGR